MSTIKELKDPLRAPTIQRALESEKVAIWTAGVYACQNSRLYLEPAQAWPWRRSFNPHKRLAALSYLPERGGIVAQELFVGLYNHEDDTVCELAWQLYQGEIPPTIVETMLHQWRDWDVANTIARECSHITVPQKVSAAWFEEGDWRLRCAAIYARAGKNISYDWLQRGLEDGDNDVLEAAIYAARLRQPPVKKFAYLASSDNVYERRVAMQIFAGREDALSLIEKGVEDTDDSVANLAAQACQGANVPLDTIEKWAHSGDNYYTPLAAAHASIGREDVPREWLRDLEACASDENLKDAVSLALLSTADRTIPPAVRCFDVAKKDRVYIPCLGGAVAVATLPVFSNICPGPGHSTGFYTDEVKIVDILGDFCGEKVGVTDSHCTYLLRKGQHHEVQNFNPFSGHGAARGFHFYLDEDHARSYYKLLTP